MEILVLGPGDEEAVHRAAYLFDHAPQTSATRSFLKAEDHHLLMAYEGERAVGYVSGVETIHPDKGTEMFLYELAVDPPFHRRGIGGSLVAALEALARARGCYGMWVITDATNAAALATYRGSGGEMEPNQVVAVWTFAR